MSCWARCFSKLGPEVPLAHRSAPSWLAVKFLLTRSCTTRQTQRRGGRPVTTRLGTLFGVRLQKPDLKEVKAWSELEGVALPKAIRRFIRSAADLWPRGQIKQTTRRRHSATTELKRSVLANVAHDNAIGRGDCARSRSDRIGAGHSHLAECRSEI